MESNNLPFGSYDDILIKCIDILNENENNDIEFTCQSLKSNGVTCNCSNLVGGTEYKIKFITRKNSLDDAIFENITYQYTGDNLKLNI